MELRIVTSIRSLTRLVPVLGTVRKREAGREGGREGEREEHNEINGDEGTEPVFLSCHSTFVEAILNTH